MQPLSNHWADIAATRVIAKKGDKEQYILASGITPSGTVHIGNFREVITVDLVARSLRALGKKVRFIYSWDNFDTFRKVPKNVPDPKAFESYLRKPIARIPDPWGQESSYSQGRIALFEREIKSVGIAPEFLYQESRYSAGLYADGIRRALEQRHKIMEILNEFRTEPLAQDWLPTGIYCSKCQKDQMKSEEYLGEWNYHYSCANCGQDETVDIRKTPNLKLAWRVDWPMRWAFEGVDFEPGGKDHSNEGGSFDTAKNIVKALWDKDPPEYLQYDFVKIKGGAGKMSSSSGELYTLGQLLEVYSPEMVRWLFCSQRPNHDFAISFDEDVFKVYDEFDRSEAFAFEAEPADPKGKPKWLVNRRNYQLSSVSEPDFTIPAPQRSSFRVMCNRLQICGGDLERTYAKFYHTQDRATFEARAHCAWFWLNNYAPEEFRYFVNQSPVVIELSSSQQNSIRGLIELVKIVDLESIDTKELNEKIWEFTINKPQCEAADAFKAIYQKLISRDQGPRLPAFLKEIGTERILELLK